MSESGYDPITKVWSGPVRPCIYNTDVSLGYIMLDLFTKTPERVTQINADDGRETTCAEMRVKSIKIATFLASLGLKQHDVIGIVAKNSENLVPVVIGCLTLGLPINPLATIMIESDISYMYGKTKPKVVFCDPEVVENVKKAMTKIGLEKSEIFTFIEKVEGHRFVDDLIEGESENVEDFVFPTLNDIANTIAFIMCSSGTTDMVKGIMKSHKQLIVNTIPVYTPRIDLPEVIFFPTQLYWDTAIIAICLNTLHGWKRVFTSKPITAELYAEIIEKFGVTFTFASPAIQYPLIKSTKVQPMRKVRTIFISGVAFTEEIVKKIENLFPNARVVGCYGTTECDIVTFSSLPQRGASSGNVSNNYQIKIIDEEGKNLGPNEKGEICIKPAALPSGYFGDPDKFANAIKDGWIFSGDLGYFDNDGYLFVLERIKFLLKSTTLHFTPGELEKIINEVPGVIESSVVGVFDEGCDVVYAFVSKNGGVDEEEVRSYVNERVNKEKSIRKVIFVENFPRTASGKIKKEELKQIAKKIHEKN